MDEQDITLTEALNDLARAYEEQRQPGDNHLMTERLADAIELVLATRGRPLVRRDGEVDDWGCQATGCHLRATRHTEDECRTTKEA